MWGKEYIAENLKNQFVLKDTANEFSGILQQQCARSSLPTL